jgi:hypothetical protein
MQTAWQIEDFPFSALPSFIQAAVSDIGAKTKSPLGLVASVALGSVALAAQGAIDVVRPDSDPSPVGLYIDVLATSGEGKTKPFDMAFAGHKQFEDWVAEHALQQAADFDVDTAEWKEELTGIRADLARARKKGQLTESVRSALRTHLQKRPVLPLTPKIIFSDTTPEAIASAVTGKWPSVGLIAGEGDGLLNGRAFQDMTLLTQTWGGERLYIDRVDRTVRPISDPRMTIVALIQPHLFFKKFMGRKGDEAHELGLFARTLITYPRSNKGYRFREYQGRAVAANGLNAFSARIFEVLQRTWDPVHGPNFKRQSVTFSEEAAIYWVALCNRIEAQMAPMGWFCNMSAYASKMGDNVARIAALFAFFCDNRMEISLGDVKRAEAIVNFYTAEHIRLFFPPPQMRAEQADAYALEAWLIKQIQVKATLCFNQRWVRQSVTPLSLRSNACLLPALYWLVTERKVLLKQEDGAQVIECNPDFYLRYLV